MAVSRYHISKVFSLPITPEKMDLINQFPGNTTFHKIFYRILTDKCNTNHSCENGKKREKGKTLNKIQLL